MKHQLADELLFSSMRRAEDVNVRAIALLEEEPGVFDKISHKIPKLMPPELGFIRTVSWLFVLYFEAGRVNRQYVSDLLPVYNLDGPLSHHPNLVQAMRTLHQHNLDIREPHDKSIFSTCYDWYSRACGTAVPEEDEEWGHCLILILEESLGYLGSLEQCLRMIEKDESRETLKSQWVFRRNRNHEPHQFDSLIPAVATDMGREHLDVIPFRRRYYDRWISQLKALSADYDFAIEARKLIEDALLKDATTVLPITGQDVMTAFGLPPGRHIGTLLGEAKRLYVQEPCSRNKLLEKLAAKAVDFGSKSNVSEPL